MGCESCSNNTGGLPRGCRNNGACGISGCDKLEVFDWLAGMKLPEHAKRFDTVEVRFKNSRKGFFRNTDDLELHVGDVVAVDASPGYDVGVVSLTGELVRVQMNRRNVKDTIEIKRVLRKATDDDIASWQAARRRENETMMRARELAASCALQMKISDVEFQGDGNKATFYYTAEDRVDFRELIRMMADSFRVRIEMRQIGMRQEAGRLGGIGSCGRELCCSTWLTDFRSVSTSAARYQQLSLNPQKLAGQCGKLKCCLNFELDQYKEAVKQFPSANTRLETAGGRAFHFKTDIFKRIMYFMVEGEYGGSPIALGLDEVLEIIEMNKRGEKPASIHEYVVAEPEPEEAEMFQNVVGQDSLTRFDRTRSRRSSSNRRGKSTGRPQRQKRNDQHPPSDSTNADQPKPGNDGGNRSTSGGQARSKRRGRPQRRNNNKGSNQGGGNAPEK
jgi:cell fate regulator YaaT (PSP1 superfamily)